MLQGSTEFKTADMLPKFATPDNDETMNGTKLRLNLWLRTFLQELLGVRVIWLSCSFLSHPENFLLGHTWGSSLPTGIPPFSDKSRP